jgi:hypothetical protein
MDRCDVELSDNSWNLSPERQAQRKDMPRTPRSVTGVEMVVNLTLILPISPLDDKPLVVGSSPTRPMLFVVVRHLAVIHAIALLSLAY